MVSFRDWVMASRLKPIKWTGKSTRGFSSEVKVDGFRTSIIVDEDKNVSAYGRKVHIDLWPKISKDESLRDLVRLLPRCTMIDGELWGEGYQSSDVPTLLNSGGFSFCCFAIPYLDAMNLELISIPEARQRIVALGFEPPEQVSVNTTDEAMALCRSRGLEGLIFKQFHYAGWYKLKVTNTIDLIINGVFSGEGKNWGRVGWMDGCLLDEGGTLVHVADIGSGLSDEERKLPFDSFVGRVCEVEYSGILSNGGLRHPRMIRWRDDKPAEECRLDQLQ